jgi:hypothetical protein
MSRLHEQSPREYAPFFADTQPGVSVARFAAGWDKTQITTYITAFLEALRFEDHKDVRQRRHCTNACDLLQPCSSRVALSNSFLRSAVVSANRPRQILDRLEYR